MNFDLVVFGGTSAGCIATVQASRLGKSVALVSVEPHLGGMSSNGLSFVDMVDPRLLGGVAREFFESLAAHYAKSSSWTYSPSFSKMTDQMGKTEDWQKEKLAWLFEPHVAESAFDSMLKSCENVTLFKGFRLSDAYSMDDERRLLSIQCVQIDSRSPTSTSASATAPAAPDPAAINLAGKVFMDCSYEGDLMALIGVTYTVGRESNAMYGERHNGVLFESAGFRKFDLAISPFQVPDQPSSGLLPRVSTNVGKSGQGDNKIEAYCFRLCVTDVAENLVPFTQPENFDASRYELLFRAIDLGLRPENLVVTSRLPNGKYDMNNRGGFSEDYVGKSWNYPEASFRDRQAIVQEHRDYQQGLMWCLQHHERVPATTHAFFSRYGLCRDEFADNGHWPYELYIREARRMVSDDVLTENKIAVNGESKNDKSVPSDVIALGHYSMDSHVVQYFADANGHVETEGGTFISICQPFPITYRMVHPRKSECRNLLVPVCQSATHIAYSAVRVEPTFMVVAQACAMAACVAVDEGCAVQDASYAKMATTFEEQNHIVKLSSAGK